MEELDNQKLLYLLFLLGKLKTIVRTGWTRYPEIKDPESVADHVFRCAAMSMFLAPMCNADPGKTTMMLVIHEIGETVIGDVVTDGGAKDLPNRDDKLRAEREAAVKVLQEAGAETYIELYDEYVANKTPEAKLANQIDKLEMGIQAREYELKYGIDLEPFYESVRRKTFGDLNALQHQIERYGRH